MFRINGLKLPRVRKRVAAVLVSGAVALSVTAIVASPAAASYSQCNAVSVAATTNFPVYYETLGTPGTPPSANCEVRFDETPTLGQRLAIWQLQMDMVECYGESITIDGLFGNGTLAAVKRTQGKLGLAQDGLAGPATRKAMKHYNATLTGGGCLAVPKTGPSFVSNYVVHPSYPYTYPY